MVNMDNSDSIQFPPYWVHCNRCFDVYINKNRAQYLLACQHIACEKCLIEYPSSTPAGAASYKCPVCAKKVRGRLLGNTLPPHLKELFHEEPWLEHLPTMRILKFQGFHQQNITRRMTHIQNSRTKLEKECESGRERARKIFEELQNARRERKELERYVRKLIEQRKKDKEENDRKQQPPRPRLASALPSTTAYESLYDDNFSYPNQQFIVTSQSRRNTNKPLLSTYNQRRPSLDFGMDERSQNSSTQIESFTNFM